MRFISVILLGLLSATATLSLLAVYALNRAGLNIMGWHASLIPLGAGLIGLGASSGFGLDERISLLLVHCPMCGAGELRIDLVAGDPALCQRSCRLRRVAA